MNSSVGKESACNAGDSGSIPGLGRSPGGERGNPLWQSCLENPMDRGAWQATVHELVTRVGYNLATKPPLTWTMCIISQNHTHITFTPLPQSFLTVTPWTATRQASLSFTNSQTLLKLMSIESVMPFSHLTLCRPLLLLPSNFPRVTVFSNESALCIRWPKYWSFSFSISLSNEYSGLISFRTDWFYLLAVQGTLKSLLQHYS